VTEPKFSNARYKEKIKIKTAFGDLKAVEWMRLIFPISEKL
jgi:hypothetical protein